MNAPDQQLTLIELIQYYEAAAELPPEQTVFASRLIGPHSYRGEYNQLAFNSERTPITAREQLEILNCVLGATYPGWKRGSFVMGLNTLTNCARPGYIGNPITPTLLSSIKGTLADWEIQEALVVASNLFNPETSTETNVEVSSAQSEDTELEPLEVMPSIAQQQGELSENMGLMIQKVLDQEEWDLVEVHIVKTKDKEPRFSIYAKSPLFDTKGKAKNATDFEYVLQRMFEMGEP